MKHICCFILLCLFFSAGTAQNDSILKCVPEKYQTGVVVYYYDKTDYYFVFKAKDYLKSLKRLAYWFRGYPQGFNCDDEYNALKKAIQQQVTTMSDEQLGCLSVKILLSQLFLRNKMKVVCKVGETSYIPVKYRVEKDKTGIKVINAKNPFVIFEGIREFRRYFRITGHND